MAKVTLIPLKAPYIRNTRSIYLSHTGTQTLTLMLALNPQLETHLHTVVD